MYLESVNFKKLAHRRLLRKNHRVRRYSFLKNRAVIFLRRFFNVLCQELTPPSAIKEDIVWCYDWDNPFDFEVALNKWINDYNTDFPHQSLRNMTPKQYLETYVNKEPVLT